MTKYLLTVFVLFITFPANAEPPFPVVQGVLTMVCSEPLKIDGALRKEHQEAPVRRGYTENGEVMQLYSSKDGSTWSLTLLTPDGMECLVTSGDKLKDVPWILSEPKERI